MSTNENESIFDRFSLGEGKASEVINPSSRPNAVPIGRAIHIPASKDYPTGVHLQYIKVQK